MAAGEDQDARSPDQTRDQVRNACQAAREWRQWREHLPNTGTQVLEALT